MTIPGSWSPHEEELAEEDTVFQSREEEPLLDGVAANTKPFGLAVFKAESNKIISLATPVIISYCLNFSLNIASIFSLGHLGTTELAAIALATMYCNVTGLSVGMGMASALDTLCSQGFTGSSDPHALGKHLQRGLVIMAFLCVPIGFLWWFTESIMLICGQDPEIAKLAGVFSRWMLPGLYPYLVGDCLRRFLQGQGIMKPSMYITMIACPVNIFLQWLLVWSPYSIGSIGAPISTSLINCFIMLTTLVYVIYFEGSSAWGGWRFEDSFNLTEIWLFLRLGLPGMAMGCAEWWAYEILALASGILGDATLAGQSIIMNVCSFMYMLSLGSAIAASTRIGNTMGAAKPVESRNVAYTALLLSLALGFVDCLIISLAHDTLGYLFTNDPEVIKIVSVVLYLAAGFQLVDAIGAVCGGILRGLGMQNFGAKLNLGSYYLFGLPLSMVFCFKLNLGLFGLWLGLFCAQICICSISVYAILNADWKELSKRAVMLANLENTDQYVEDDEERQAIIDENSRNSTN